LDGLLACLACPFFECVQFEQANGWQGRGTTMNGTTEVPQEYDQRDMFFFVHAGLVPEKTDIY
jgi:hypothetical protein